MKTSDQGRSPSSKGSVSGQKACGAPGDLKSSPEHLSVVGALPEEAESLPTSGEMASPNFPRNYLNDLHERKTIEVSKGNVINIHFTDFQLEAEQVDYVEITDGGGTLLGRFGGKFFYMDEGSGHEEPRRNRDRISDITSVSETVHVLFHTDESVTRRGWRLEWSKYIFLLPSSILFQGSSPSPSSEGEMATTGVLTSLNFPERYPSSINQVQKIQVPEGNTIWIRFSDFECERDFDYVTVTDKDGRRLGLFDGGVDSEDDWQKEIVSNTDMVEVRFHTDSSGTDKGWRLDWGKTKVSIIILMLSTLFHRNGWRACQRVEF